MRFARQNRHVVREPELLGLPAGTVDAARSTHDSVAVLMDGLVRGQFALCREVVFSLFLAGNSATSICETVIAPAMHRIGELWNCGNLEIYQERRACEIAGRLLHELRLGLPTAPMRAPLAMGTTPEGDLYSLPTRMVELALAEQGWRAISLGNSLPLETLAAACGEHRPQLFWLSVSHIEDVEKLAAGLNKFGEHSDETRIVIGGQAVTLDFQRRLHSVTVVSSLSELAELANQIRPRPTKGSMNGSQHNGEKNGKSHELPSKNGHG